MATIFRKFHTLKGNAASLEFARLGAFAHRLEDLLDTLRSGSAPVTPELVTFLLQAVDVVRTVLPAIADGTDHVPPGRGGPARSASKERRLRGPAAAAEPVPPAASTDEVDPAGESARTLRIDVDRIDSLLRVASEIAIAGDRVGQLVEEEGSPALADAYRSLARLLASLHRSVSMVRMVPIGPLLRRQARTVRDVAGGQKQVELVVSDQGVEVDNSVIEQLKAPLTHLVRNAVDHGVEDPEARVRAGKDASARVALRARHEGSDIVLEIEDDGAGLDRARILERARALGVVGARRHAHRRRDRPAHLQRGPVHGAPGLGRLGARRRPGRRPQTRRIRRRLRGGGEPPRPGHEVPHPHAADPRDHRRTAGAGGRPDPRDPDVGRHPLPGPSLRRGP